MGYLWCPKKESLLSPSYISNICDFQMSIAKGEECIMLDNFQKTKWNIRNSNGMEGLVPAVCFLIPPPDEEAIGYANL